MKVLMTGAAGFIGGHAYETFVSSGDEVLVVDKFSYAADPLAKDRILNFVEMDICDQNLFDLTSDFNPDIIVNFAAETHVDNSISNSKEFIKSNVLGTSNILDVCKAFNLKLCHVSTDEVYGPAYDYPFTELDPLKPMNPYSATKASADLMIQAYHNTHNIQYVIVRPSNNYGPRQNKEKFIPKLVDCILNKTKFPLYGAGDQLREWTYVVDTGKIIKNIINVENSWNSIYNISSGIMHSNLEVIQQVLNVYEKLSSKNLDINDILENVKDRPGHDRKYWISTKKLDSFVKVEYTDFQSGLEKTITSYAW